MAQSGMGRGRAGGGWGERKQTEALERELHIPFLLGNERPVVLRNHVLSQVQLLRVILVAQSPVPVAVLTGFCFIHCEIGPLGILIIFGVGAAHLALSPSTTLLLFFLLIAASS